MHFDLLTLYYLAIGTLLVSAALTFWERQVRPARSASLRTLAAGYAVLAAGCAAATLRSDLPGPYGTALSNLMTVAGYLLILDGVASLSGRSYRTASLGIMAALAAVWAVAGDRWPDAMWSYVGGLPIAMASGAAMWEVVRSNPLRTLRSWHVIALVTGGHALLYAARAFLLPVLEAYWGGSIVSMAGKLTIYEGVLYSVVLPMTLLALIREEAQNQLLEASRTDYLTGLGNRRWFFEEGARLVRPGRTYQPASLLAFDLDHFKAINDRHGHATGDDVLKSFARVAERALGPGTILARMGGEEFAALMPGYDVEHARRIGEILASCFSEHVALALDGAPVSATVSIGLAQLGRDGTDLSSLLAAADRALYAAKALGRNRIEMALPVSLAA